MTDYKFIKQNKYNDLQSHQYKTDMTLLESIDEFLSNPMNSDT